MLPTAYLEQMETLLDDEFDAFKDSYNDSPSIGLRVNTLKLDPELFFSLFPHQLNSISWTEEGFTLPPNVRPGKHPYHAAGLYYLQDPSAMAVTTLLDPKPGDRVLDLAAAPGGKTTHIAAKMGNRGILVANDINPKRVRILSNNLERWGARNVIVLNETPARLSDHFGAYFDKVLVDAPCSGEGMFRKDPASRQEWTQKLVERSASRQDEILYDAARLVRPGGKLVYATCTFTPTENEGTINRFINSHADYKIAETRHYPGFSRGRPDWISEDAARDLVHTVRIWPHKAPGEGHFIAVLKRMPGSIPDFNIPGPCQPSALSPEASKYFDEFVESTLNWQPDEDNLSMHGTYIYLLPEGMPDIQGLCVNHWGWWLGTVKVKRFEPSHAMVMALQAGDLKQETALRFGDPEIRKFMCGESIPSKGDNGWCMVSIDGFPLGWTKRVQNRLKSHVPRWLRWM